MEGIIGEQLSHTLKPTHCFPGDGKPLMTMPSKCELLLACEALAALVRDEYPRGYALAEIVSTWGSASAEQIAAIAAIETQLEG